MKTNMISLLTKIACLASLLTVVACAGSTSDQRSATVKSASSTASVAPSGEEEEGAADKVVCKASSDCDSDERCDNGKCVGLDGDRD
jgi:hypothetical protein